MPRKKSLATTTSRNRLPKLSDVAARAEVSTATVSRVLNSPEQVVADTRKRVLKAVNELGYAPNFNARALATNQTNTIGAVIPTMDNSFFARGLQAFQEELVRHGKTLLVAPSAYDVDLEEKQIRALVARGADAILLIGYDRSPDIYRFLEQRGTPVIVSWAYDENETRRAVGFDNRAAMAALARQVIFQGHKQIACITAPTAFNDRARGRVNGIRDAMAEAGQCASELFVVETSYGIETGETALREIMAGAPATTAVMCVNDVLAVGALRAAREMGLRVPKDISITGFDDIDVAILAEPALTTVQVPHREMGRRAAGMLIELLQGGEIADSVEVTTEIRLRKSLGPVRIG